MRQNCHSEAYGTKKRTYGRNSSTGTRDMKKIKFTSDANRKPVLNTIMRFVNYISVMQPMSWNP